MFGKYICFEGVNGSGKSTMVTPVADVLDAGGYLACPVEFPSERTAAGQLIRSYLRGDHDLQNAKAMIYLYAADAHLVDPWLRANLASGTHVVADRHPYISGRVYQLAHHTCADIEQIYATTDIRTPDHLFIIDVPVEVAIERMRVRAKYEAKHYETKKISLFEEYRDRYLALAETAVARGLAQHCHVLDGTRRLADLAVEAVAALNLPREAR